MKNDFETTENTSDLPTVSVFTLGCKTNLYESQQIVAALRNEGFRANFGLKRADIFVINTCAVTKEAESKSRQAIARVRKINPAAAVFMVGCAIDKNSKQFLDKQGVVAVAGNSQKGKLAEIIKNYLSDKTADYNERLTDFDLQLPPKYDNGVFAVPSHTRAFVKIQDGCDNFCSYCIVPYLRGRSRSRSIQSIVDEIKQNPDAKEFVLIGIDISQYQTEKGGLPELFDALSFCPARIRLGSIYQNCITEKLLIAMKDRCKHFHLSLQSGCDKTLKDMNRHYTTAQYAKTVDLIRKFYPDTAITTDIIVGFCGETDEDFSQTVKFAEKIAFADIHVFPYSPREGTTAFSRPTPPAQVVAQRVKTLGALKEKLHKEYCEKFIGKTMTVLTEEQKSGYVTGYTDNYIKVYLSQKLPLNQLVDVEITQLYSDGVLAKPKN